MIIKEFLNFEPEKEFRYTAFIYKGDKTKGDKSEDDGLPVNHKTKYITIFEEFSVKAKNQESADKKASEKVVKLYPSLKNYINFWRCGERGDGLMFKFRPPGEPKGPREYKPSWD